MKRSNLLFAALLLAGVASRPAIAGASGTDEEYHAPGPYRTQSDIKIMNDVAAQLYGRDHVAKGDSLAWKNPSSKHYGTISVIDVFEGDGKPCRKLTYHTVFDQAYSTNYIFTWCRLRSGEWKIH